MRSHSLAFGLIFVALSVSAQFDVLTSNLMNVGADGYNGNGISFFDFNGDGSDDVTLAAANGVLRFFQNNGSGQFLEVFLGIEDAEGSNDAKHVVWVDFDNDGDPDCFVTYNNAPCRLWRNDGDQTFTDVSATSGITQTSSWETNGSAWGDYDRDGYLDVYLTNYNVSGGVTNYLFHNNGDGTFTNVTSSCNCSDGVQNSFQALWYDYNGDNWLDLVIINDRLFYPNDILRNNGNGTFSSVGSQLGFDQMIYAMSITCGDYDNDDDFDIYVTNGLDGNIFMEFDLGSGFTDIAPSLAMTVNDVCWGAAWIDYDNDQWQDLIVGTYPWGMPQSENLFFVNQLGDNFSTDNSIIENNVDNVYALAMGDLTNDGYPDLVLHTLNSASTTIMRNLGGENHYLKVGLEGTQSNRDGVGSLIEVWSGGIKQKRFTYCGENYLGQSSHYEFFGLGQNEVADSLKVSWPSGFIDVLYDVSADQTLEIIEGETFQVNIGWDGPVCEDQITFLSIDASEGSSIEWSTGSNEDTIGISQEGTYSVEVISEFGIPAYDTLEVFFNPLPEAAINITNVTCAGWNDGTIELFNVSGVPITDVTWPGTEYSGLTINGLSGGTYNFIMIDENGCQKAGEASVSEPEEIVIDMVLEQPDCFGELGFASATATGGTGLLTFDWGSIEDPTLIEAGDHLLMVTDEASCTEELSFNIVEPEVLEASFDIVDANDGANGSINASISGGTEPYSVQWSNGQTGEMIDGLTAGVYTVLITDANGCTLSDSFSLVDLSVGIEHMKEFRVYVESQLLVLSNNSDHYLNWERYDSSGRMIDKGAVSPEEQLELPLKCLNCLEFIRVYAGQYSRTFKVMH